MKLKLLTLSMLIREVVDHHHIYRCIKHMYRHSAVSRVLVIYINLDTKVVLTKLYFSHMGAFFQRMTNWGALDKEWVCNICWAVWHTICGVSWENYSLLNFFFFFLSKHLCYLMLELLNCERLRVVLTVSPYGSHVTLNFAMADQQFAKLLSI